MNHQEIENALGYVFKDKKLLEAAFTHVSYANQCGGEDGEKLEFLGDAVLDFIVADFLFDKKGRDEGQMTVRRSKIVSKIPLAKEVDRLGLNNFVRYGRGFKPDQDMSTKLRSNIFEAALGAIYKDGGIGAAQDFVWRSLLSNFKEDGAVKDYKTHLQEFLQAKGQKADYYDEEMSVRPPKFRSRVVVDGAEIASGEGGSKKAAQQEAAQKALSKLK